MAGTDLDTLPDKWSILTLPELKTWCHKLGLKPGASKFKLFRRLARHALEAHESVGKPHFDNEKDPNGSNEIKWLHEEYDRHKDVA